MEELLSLGYQHLEIDLWAREPGRYYFCHPLYIPGNHLQTYSEEELVCADIISSRPDSLFFVDVKYIELGYVPRTLVATLKRTASRHNNVVMLSRSLELLIQAKAFGLLTAYVMDGWLAAQMRPSWSDYVVVPNVTFAKAIESRRVILDRTKTDRPFESAFEIEDHFVMIENPLLAVR